MEAIINPSLKLLKVKLLRNVKGYNFKLCQKDLSDSLKNKIIKVFKKADIYDVKDLTVGAIRDLTKKGIIDFAFAENQYSFIAELKGKTKIYIAVGGEDMLSISAISQNLDCIKLYETVFKAEQALQKEVLYSYNETFGYLTADPLHIGTGLVISVFLTLTNLEENGKISELKAIATENGFYLGRVDEDSEYLIKNNVTLGVTEYEIISAFNQFVMSVLNAEQELKI